MKLIDFPVINDYDKIIADVEVNTLAFSNITFGENFMFINFECTDIEDHALFSLTVPVVTESPEEEAYARELYEDDLCPSGLLMTKENLPSLMIMDHFRKKNIDQYTAVCLDTGYGHDPENKDKYNVVVSTKQFILIMAIIHDAMQCNFLHYQSHWNIYNIPNDCSITDIDASTELEILAINTPKEKISGFGDQYKEFPVQVLCKFEKSYSTNDGLVQKVVMNLAYRRSEAKIIQKNNKFQDIDTYIKNDKDNIFIVIDHTMIEYSINAKNPIAKLVWIAQDKNRQYKLFTMLQTQYIEIVQQINDILIK